MKPIHSFLFFFFIILLIIFIGLVFSGFANNEYTYIKVPDFEKFIGLFKKLDTTEVNEFESGVLTEEGKSTSTDNSGSSYNKLEFPPHDNTILYPVYSKLRTAREHPDGIRILYFGDSQIEGDRITSYLRERLQERFGGRGPGFIAPEMVVSYTRSVHVSGSSNWQRYSIQDLKEGLINHNRFGLLMSYCSFTPPYLSEMKNAQRARIRIGASDMGYTNSETYQMSRLLLDGIETTLQIKYITGSGTHVETVQPEPGFQIIKTRFAGYLTKLEIELSSLKSPRFLGIALDDTSGLAIDNIPIRGSRGTDFSLTDTALMREMVAKLGVEMIIMQFGPNIATNIRGKYEQYERKLTEELLLLKGLGNEMPILVVGISDMVVPKDPTYSGNSDLERIRDAQKNAAFRSGCAFWDLYTLMGGEGSMEQWFQKEPPLARPDRVHFSSEGAEYVAEQLYQAFMKNYTLFELNQE